jgi:hypothetical protein
MAVYNSHEKAERAIRLLNADGYKMMNLSIIGQDYETQERPIGFLNAGDRMLAWGKFGAFWGSIWGLLFGSAMLVIPGLGFLLFAGYIVAAVEGAVILGGFSALAGALASIGIPNDSIIRYESELKAGSFLVIAHGTEGETARARDILASALPTDIKEFSQEPVPIH